SARSRLMTQICPGELMPRTTLRLTVVTPLTTVTFDTGITPIPPSNLTRVLSSAASGDARAADSTHANMIFFTRPPSSTDLEADHERPFSVCSRCQSTKECA